MVRPSAAALRRPTASVARVVIPVTFAATVGLTGALAATPARAAEAGSVESQQALAAPAQVAAAPDASASTPAAQAAADLGNAGESEEKGLPTAREDSVPTAGDPSPDDGFEPAAAADAKAASQTPQATAPLATASDGSASAATSDPVAEPERAVAPYGVDMYRLFNPYTGEHFYTASTLERDHLHGIGWSYEGVGWVAPEEGDAVYRLYNPFTGDHHFTLSSAERDMLHDAGWNYEGVGWRSAGADGLAVYREYNPYATVGSHNFTQSLFEHQSLKASGWQLEGIAWYALDTADAERSAYLVAEVSTKTGEARSVVSTVKDNVTYLFLPSFAGDSVRLSAFLPGCGAGTVQLKGRGGWLEVAPGAEVGLDALGSFGSDGRLSLSMRVGEKGYAFPLVVMRSANIDALFVSSADLDGEGRPYVDGSPSHATSASVSVRLVTAKGKVVYDEDDPASDKASTIKGRGNSTWAFSDKKPYQVKLSKKADLLQTGDKSNKAKKWVLLANADDATLLHNTISYDLALELGMVGVQSKPVDLYYDGEYRGTYVLCEKVEIGDGRVEIDDLEKAIEKANGSLDLETAPIASAKNKYGYEYHYAQGVADPDDITGGYLLEIDSAYGKNEKCWFDTSVGTFVVKSPEVASQNVVRYISEAVQEAINNASAGRFNLGEGFSFELDSLARTYLVSEFTKNIDAFCSSTYFYKASDSTGSGNVLVASPLWDFDGAYGIRTDLGDSAFGSYQNLVLLSGEWVVSNPTIMARVRTLYTQELRPLVADVLLGAGDAKGPSGILRGISSYQSEIAASQRMNEVVFGLSHFGNTMKPLATWQDNVLYLKDWLSNRMAWFDQSLSKLTSRVAANTGTRYDGFDYGLVFDARYYLQMNPDVRTYAQGDDGKALQHFVQHGMAEGRTASRNFDVNYYRANNADLRAVFGDDLASYYRHYCMDGFPHDGRKGKAL